MIADVASIYRDDRAQRATAFGIGVPLFCIWLLGLATFSLPGREGPAAIGSFDAVALIKTGARAVALLLLSVAIWRSRTLPRTRSVLRGILPFGLFLVWAILSTAWSPLKVVSLGQAGGLAAQLMLATCLAIRWNGSKDTETILRHLCLLLLIVSATVAAVHLFAPQYSALDRELERDGAGGLVHPTAAGATASLGLLVLLAIRFLWNWRWVRRLVVPGVLVHSAVLVMANSRTALALTVVVALMIVLLLTSRPAFAALVVVTSLLIGGYLVVDPGLEAADGTIQSTTTFLDRGGGEDQYRSFNGRTELWEVVWSEFRKSPIRGYGYFVTSEAGELDVWGLPASNMTAHNVVLQVLASTGVIGGVLLAWGLAVPVLRVLKSIGNGSRARSIVTFVLLLWAWYLGWGQLCSSFTGPIQPETIVFFSTLGLAFSAVSSAGSEPGEFANARDRRQSV